MPIQSRKKEGETTSAFLFRFNKRIKQSGVLKEAKKRRFQARPANRRKKKIAALYREDKRKEIEHKKKLGFM